MRGWAGVLIAAAALLAGGAPAATSQTANVGGGADGARPAAGAAMVTYQFLRPGLPVPRFRIQIREDGTGSYVAEEVPGGGAGDAPASGSSQGAAAKIEREIALTPATTAKIFKTARAERYFNTPCASKMKNIADTGAKTLSYEGPDGKGSCSYNYTENKGVSMLTDLFLGIGETLDEGRKLEFKRRYDRLGLDAQLDVLTQANDAGRAVELGTIAPLLRELAGDTETMQRVRLRAAKLLDRVADGR